MNRTLLLSFFFCLCFSFAYSQPSTLGVTVLTPPPLAGGSSANIGIAIIGGTPFSTYTVTLTCNDCTSVTKDINTNNLGIALDTDFNIEVPNTGTSVTFEAIFFGPDCAPCNQQALPSPVSLPVELVAFDAEERGQNINLSWATAAEINNSHFDVLYSQDGKSFESIGQIEGAGTTNDWNNYEFLHRLPSAGNNYYQLKQTDFDGQTSSSDIIVINWDKEQQTEVTIFPNPTADWIELNANAPMTKVQLLDSNGRTVYLMNKDLGYHHHFDLSSSLSNGIYFLKIDLENGEQKLEKVLIKS